MLCMLWSHSMKRFFLWQLLFFVKLAELGRTTLAKKTSQGLVSGSMNFLPKFSWLKASPVTFKPAIWRLQLHGRGWLFPVCVFPALWQHRFLLRGRQMKRLYSTPSFRRKRLSETEGYYKIPWARSSLEVRGYTKVLGNLFIPSTALVSGKTCQNRVIFSPGDWVWYLPG